MQIHRYLELDAAAEAISCTECGTTICNAEENYRKHSAMRTGPITEAGVPFVPPEDKIGRKTDLEFREFFCPECAVLLQTEFAKEDDPIIHDIEIDLESLSE
jgi:acetone carboxylase gamma subunit